jgi:hypothetical protein
MEDAAEEGVSPQEKPVPRSRVGWKVLWFGLHLAAVYVIVKFCTPWLAGWTRGTLLPLLQLPVTSKRSEFLVSHLFALSFVPAFLAGFINARFRQKAAQFACLVPAAILAYRFVNLPCSVRLSKSICCRGLPVFRWWLCDSRTWRLARSVESGYRYHNQGHGSAWNHRVLCRSCIEGSKRDN